METIVYFGPQRPAGDPLGLLDKAGTRALDAQSYAVSFGARPVRRERRFVCFSDPNEAARFVEEQPVHALVLDTRSRHFLTGEGNTTEPGAFYATPAGILLRRLFPESQVAWVLPRDRVIPIVATDRDATDTAYHLGSYRMGDVLIAPTLTEVLARLEPFFTRRGAGRIAICLAGGGIEGMLYELGVLRALEGFLKDRPLIDFDLFCGISAGAVIASFLANGVGPDEIAQGLQGKSRRIDPISRMQLFDPNVSEVSARSVQMLREFLHGGTGPRGILSSLARATPSAAFAGNGLRKWLEAQLTKPGMSNSFEQLRRPLFVGATDQDTSEHVVFGEKSTRHVPIHRAVRASAAMTPIYAPEMIDGRYYIDGAFSRTTNMRVAVDHGATLVILVDPLVPVYSRKGGYVHARGGIFGTMQGLKGIINGRFDKAIRAIRDMHPDVAFHLFRPEREEMRILSGSPMKYFYRREVEEIAFESTNQKIRSMLPTLTRDFAQHGVTFRDPLSKEGDSRRVSPVFEPGSLGIGV